MPFLLVPMIVGEPNSIGEEKFCNKFLRKVNAGSKFTHSPLSPVVMSMAGGDCEHGGLFFVLFKEWQRKKLNYFKNSSSLKNKIDFKNHIGNNINYFKINYNLSCPKISVDILNKNKKLYFYNLLFLFIKS